MKKIISAKFHRTIGLIALIISTPLYPTQSPELTLKHQEMETQRALNQKTRTKELGRAAAKRDINKMIELVRKGVDINAQDKNGNTPLHHALRSQKKRVLKVAYPLLALGADPFIKANDDKTPLDIALESNNNALQDLLIDQIMSSQAPIEKMTPVDISFVIADIKYDGQIKICELGDGHYSYFKGHEQLYGQGKIWAGLWNHLSTFKLPIWYVATKPNSLVQNTIAFDTFTKLGGKWVGSIYELTKDPQFLAAKEKPVKNIHDIRDYQGIVILRQKKDTPEVIAKFKKKNPGFIVLNNASTHFVGNKKATNKIFLDKNIQAFKPRWGIYNKNYSQRLAHTIFDDLLCEKFVIKPLDAANGWGVLIVSLDELDRTLNKILSDTIKIKYDGDPSYNYWARDDNKEFLVEEYAPSKPLIINEKEYDGTMRMIFMLTYNNKKITPSFIGCYWKLPTHALSDEGTLTNLHKSNISEFKNCSARVSPHDACEVKKQLLELLPQLYGRMLDGRMPNDD